MFRKHRIIPLGVLALISFGTILSCEPNTRGQGSEEGEFTQQLSYALVRNARHLCAVIFVVGRTQEEAMKIGDVARWGRLIDWWDWDKTDIKVDLERGRVTLSRPPAPPRTAMYSGDQGCTMLPPGEDSVLFDPIKVPSNLPPADETPWPMGDVTEGQVVRGIDQAKVQAVLDEIFTDNDPEAGERGWVVLHEGKIVGERYGTGYDKNTRNLNFSSGKSITATFIGILVRDGHLNVKDRAPIAEWAYPDARRAITIENLMHMASGLAANHFALTAPNHYTRENHHFYTYFEGVDIYADAIERHLGFVPGSTYQYRNGDNQVLGKIIRDVVEREYDTEYLAWPRREFFDKIGGRRWLLETDPYGNFHFNGMTYASTRDWARVGLLYQQDGVYNGERILPAGWAAYVSTPSPAEPSYGANWRVATPASPLPSGSFWATGAEGQQTVVIPSHRMVMSHHAWNNKIAFDSVMARIADAVVKTEDDCRNEGWRAYNFEEEGSCLRYVRQRGPIPDGKRSVGADTAARARGIP